MLRKGIPSVSQYAAGAGGRPRRHHRRFRVVRANALLPDALLSAGRIVADLGALPAAGYDAHSEHSVVRVHADGAGGSGPGPQTRQHEVPVTVLAGVVR